MAAAATATAVASTPREAAGNAMFARIAGCPAGCGCATGPIASTRLRSVERGGESIEQAGNRGLEDGRYI